MTIQLLNLGAGDKIIVIEGGTDVETELTLREPPDEKPDGTIIYLHEGGAKIVMGEHQVEVDGKRYRRIPLKGFEESF